MGALRIRSIQWGLPYQPRRTAASIAALRPTQLTICKLHANEWNQGDRQVITFFRAPDGAALAG